MRHTISIVSIALSIIFFENTANAEVNDPYEGLNRKINTLNITLDNVAFRPLAKGYEFIIPKFVRRGVANVLNNLYYPTTFVNQFLQGNVKLGLQDTSRFLINTTLGIGGIFDVANKFELYANNEDFGQTFAVWGIGSGPYLVLPLWGPSTFRGAVSSAINVYTDPLVYIRGKGARNTALLIEFTDIRYRMFKSEELISGDKYLFMRDAYLQNREFLINNGKVEESDPFLDDE